MGDFRFDLSLPKNIYFSDLFRFHRRSVADAGVDSRLRIA